MFCHKHKVQIALHFKTYTGILVTSQNYIHDKTGRINSANPVSMLEALILYSFRNTEGYTE